uniref:Aluminum-activated malate transporter n=1 Tax=Chenopodium quinoa TaxID=63459 RepID=A0A803LXN3_CHEQI
MATMNVVSSPNNETKGGCTRACQFLTSLPKSLKDNVVNFALEAKKLGQDDPRKIFHALKVGFAITVVSLFYYFQALYNGFGVSAMWAVITVVVVFEFTVASILTFMRFFPKLKAKYDYGLMIFILTFALVAVSGYRDDEVIKIAQQRLVTIIIGSCIAMLICILISPVWTGAELHNLIASNMEKLGNFLEGFGSEYMTTKDEKSKEEKSFRQQYKSVLGTKSTEETMANFAFWEPSHGKFKFRHPWKQYLKVGALIRKCAYSIDALNNYLNPNILQMQTPEEIEEMMKERCKKLSSELGKVLKEAAKGFKKMRKTSTPKTQLAETKEAAKELKRLLQDTSLWEKCNLLDVLPAVTVASILIDIVDCVESIIEAVHELASMASMGSEIVCPEKERELSQIVVVGDVTDIHNHKVIPVHKLTTSPAQSQTKTSH